jgi:hypothetical protein
MYFNFHIRREVRRKKSIPNSIVTRISRLYFICNSAIWCYTRPPKLSEVKLKSMTSVPPNEKNGHVSVIQIWNWNVRRVWQMARNWGSAGSTLWLLFFRDALLQNCEQQRLPYLGGSPRVFRLYGSGEQLQPQHTYTFLYFINCVPYWAILGSEALWRHNHLCLDPHLNPTQVN